MPALLATADALVELFRTRFFDPNTGSLGEFFTDDWQWAPGVAGTHVEPGHHYEWVWLLNEYQRLSGRPVEPERSALYAFANRCGRDAKTGLVRDVVDRRARFATVARGSGRRPRRSRRIWSWPTAAEVARVIGNLLDHFVAGNRAGTWTEHLAPDGTRKSDRIPASTLYHVFSAFSELERAFGKATCAPERA